MVGEAVFGPVRDSGGLVGGKRELFVPPDNGRDSRDNHPVLAALSVKLEA